MENKDIPEVAKKSNLTLSVEHFTEKVKTVPEWINKPNKELWAISQIYRSWEIHKSTCEAIRERPKYNNDDIIEEVSKKYAVIPQDVLDHVRTLLWNDGYADKSEHVRIIERYLHPDRK